MKTLLLFLAALLFPALSSCALAKKVAQPYGPKKVTRIPDGLIVGQEKTCYMSPLGVVYFAANGSACPEGVDYDGALLAACVEYGVSTTKWDGYVVVFVDTILEVIVVMDDPNTPEDETEYGEAWGATWAGQPESGGTGSVVSSWIPDRTEDILVHEFSHQAIYFKGDNQLEHMCLDNPDLCKELGE